jgi:hypothetical protein
MTFIMFWVKPYKHWAKRAKKTFSEVKNEPNRASKNVKSEPKSVYKSRQMRYKNTGKNRQKTRYKMTYFKSAKCASKNIRKEG